MDQKKSWPILPVLTAIMMGLTSCQNGNLFGGLHKSGDSSDVKTLDSDATVALENGNYNQALEIAQHALSISPNNSQALSLAAAAAVEGSGINIGLVIANFSGSGNTANSSAVRNLGDAISQSRRNASALASCGGANSILAGVDCDALNDVINTAICRLQTIVSGAGDGTVSPNDPNTLLNLGLLCIIRAILEPIRAGYLDIVNNSGTYTVVQKSTINNFCSGNPQLLQQMAGDVAAAYALFNKAVTLLNISNTGVIVQIRNDISTVGTELLTSGTSECLPDACLATLAAPPTDITKSNFESKIDIFIPPAHAC